MWYWTFIKGLKSLYMYENTWSRMVIHTIYFLNSRIMKKTSREMYYRHRYEMAKSFTEKNIVIGQAEIFMLEQQKALFESGTATIMVGKIPC